MKVAVLTDTNSGISVEEAEDMGIFCIPMPVIMDGENYIEGVNLTHEECFSYMEAGRDISTSQPSTGDLLETWDKILSMGYDEIIYIPMSSGLSSSTNTALTFANEYDGQVEVADNHRISVTQRHAVMDAIYLRNMGKNAKEIKKILELSASDSVVYLAVDTLDYFRKTGRINAPTAALANVLGIRPVLKTTGDLFGLYSAVRGNKKVPYKIVDAIKEEMETRFRGVEHSNLIIGTAGSFTRKEDGEAWLQIVKEAFPDIEVFYNELSCSVSCHTGPNAMGLGISKRVVL